MQEEEINVSKAISRLKELQRYLLLVDLQEK
jgi:hypothetical protein